MPDLDDVLQRIARTRTALIEAEDAISVLRARQAKLKVEYGAALAAGDTIRATQVGERLGIASERLKNKVDARAGLVDDIAGIASELIVQRTPEQLVETLDGGIPVAMMPVRIEGRFDGPTTLRVRVFPDQIHIDAHDPALTADETDGARWYWEHRWAAGLEDTDAATDAWNALIARFRPQRAAYLVAALTPINRPADGPAVFPDVVLRESAWSRPAVATALPDRFAVVGLDRDGDGWVERFRVWGSAVPDRLAVAPDPHAMSEPAAAGILPVDPGTAWTRDPAIAQDAGVLIRIDDPALADGIDRLVVVGVDWTKTPQDAAASLNRLLHAQRVSSHLQFVPQGTPTNVSSTTTADAGADANEAAALDPARTPSPAPASAGERLSRALGFNPVALADVPGAGLRDQVWASALADVLWRATAGYFIQDLLDPLGNDASLVADDPHIDADLRDFVSRHLFASGPLPTLRVGSQPYGVLPVVAARRYESLRRTEKLVLRVASTLRTLVAPAIAEIPTLRRAGEDQDVDTMLLALLQRSPVPASFSFRGLTGPVERKNIGVNWERRHTLQGTWSTLLWSQLGVTVSPRLSELTLGKRHPLRVPLVAAATENPTAYLREIAELTSHSDGRIALNLKENSATLLEALAALAALQELDRCALQRVRDVVTVSAEQLATLPALRNLHIAAPESVRVEQAPTQTPSVLDFRTGRQLADTVIPQWNTTTPVGNLVTAEFADRLPNINALLGAPTDPYHWLARFRTALETLSQASPDELDWATRGHLSLYSTRLDAWFTALAAARLEEHRSRKPEGVHIGCWGFVEDVRRDAGTAAESLGFVHAPSQAHAVTAALLRNARLTDRTEDGDVFDIELTSARVRRARWLLDGIAQGQRLAALLGYRIERRLREESLTLMQYQLPLRRAAPLSGDRTAPEEPVEVLAARDVVDGVAVLDRWAAGAASRQSLLHDIAIQAGTTSLPDAHANGLRAVLDDVASDYDAVSDVLIAEAVHQTALGDLARSGAALAAHDRHGRAADLDVVTTPRSGSTITHRVLVVEQPGGPATGWLRDARAIAEPLLEAWAARMLGAPTQWSFTALAVTPAPGGNGPETSTVLGALDLTGLGLGALSTALATRRAGATTASELEQRLALAFAAVAPPAADTRIELLADPPAGASGGLALLTTLGEWIAAVADSPVATPIDLREAGSADPTAGPAGTIDVAELNARAQAVRAQLDAVLVALSQTTTPAQCEGALLEASLFDGPDAIPQVPHNHPDAATVLVQQAAEVLARLTRMSTEVSTVLSQPEPDGEGAQVAYYTTLITRMLGAAQPVLPRFTLADAAPVTASLGIRDALLGGDPDAPTTWLHQYALVQPDLDPLSALLLHDEARGSDVSSALGVVQLPHTPEAIWQSLPFPPEKPPAHGALGLVVHSAAPLQPDQPLAGVVVASWTETIPASSETTALTFHYDAPGARPPQAILLAVHPQPRPGPWSMQLLLDTVNEAADLARVRMLSAKELAGLGPLLPAIYLPDDYTHDQPSLSLFKLQRDLSLSPISTILGKQ